MNWLVSAYLSLSLNIWAGYCDPQTLENETTLAF